MLAHRLHYRLRSERAERAPSRCRSRSCGDRAPRTGSTCPAFVLGPAEPTPSPNLSTATRRVRGRPQTRRAGRSTPARSATTRFLSTRPTSNITTACAGRPGTSPVLRPLVCWCRRFRSPGSPRMNLVAARRHRPQPPPPAARLRRGVSARQHVDESASEFAGSAPPGWGAQGADLDDIEARYRQQIAELDDEAGRSCAARIPRGEDASACPARSDRGRRSRRAAPVGWLDVREQPTPNHHWLRPRQRGGGGRLVQDELERRVRCRRPPDRRASATTFSRGTVRPASSGWSR